MSRGTASLGILCFGIVMFLGALISSQSGLFGNMSQTMLNILLYLEWLFLTLQFAFFFLVRDKK